MRVSNTGSPLVRTQKFPDFFLKTIFSDPALGEAAASLACSRLSVSGYNCRKTRAGDERDQRRASFGRERGGFLFLYQTPLVARPFPLKRWPIYIFNLVDITKLPTEESLVFDLPTNPFCLSF